MPRAKREAVRKLPRLRIIKGESKPKPAGSRAVRMSYRDSEKHLEYARNVMQAEANAILRVGERLGDAFVNVLKRPRFLRNRDELAVQQRRQRRDRSTAAGASTDRRQGGRDHRRCALGARPRS